VPIIAGIVGRMALLGGAGLIEPALFYAVMIPPAIAFFKTSAIAWDALIMTAPIQFQRAYYLVGLNIMLEMFTTSLLAGITARMTSGVFRKALGAVK